MARVDLEKSGHTRVRGPTTGGGHAGAARHQLTDDGPPQPAARPDHERMAELVSHRAGSRDGAREMSDQLPDERTIRLCRLVLSSDSTPSCGPRTRKYSKRSPSRSISNCS